MAFDWASLIGPALGAFGGWKAGGDTTTTQTLPQPMMDYWGGFSNLAQQVASRPYQNTVAPFTQDQYGAMDQIRAQSQGGPEQQLGSQALQNFLKGPSANPYLQGAIADANKQVMGAVNTGAFNSGSFGNSGIGETATRALANRTDSLYNNALNQTMQAIPQALTYQNQNLANSSALLQSGAMQQQQGQSVLNNWWNYPQEQLKTYGMPLNFAQGSQTTQQGNPWASALGGGLLGLQFGNAFTPPPQTGR